METDDDNLIDGPLSRSEEVKRQAIHYADTCKPLKTTDESPAAAYRTTSRFTAPLVQRLTLTNMEDSNFKSQPAPIHWAVGWADLMMTMFVLFLVMYLFQSPQQRQMAEHGLASPSVKTVQKGPSAEGDRTILQEVKAGNVGQSKMEEQTNEGNKPEANMIDDRPDHKKMEMTRLYDLVILTLRDKDLAKFADIELSPDQTVRIVLAADLLFPSGNAELGAIAREKIREIASLLKKTPYVINVAGHTDNVPIKSGPFATNWELSVMRATTVARFLIEEMGVPAAQFSVTGHSYYQPQANNDTSVNRANNRRVEIIISREQQPTIPITANPSLL
jgi:chemotaxis protein MotB